MVFSCISVFMRRTLHMEKHRNLFEEAVLEMLEHLHRHLLRIDERTNNMSAATDRLTASVAALTSAEKSAVALLGQLAQLIRDNAEDPAALNKIADDIDADTTEIAAAVVANTPAAPPAPEPTT
jgi:peptidoglycan hydrolase CwlO-like protein